MLQFDNCWRDNKNKWLFGFLNLLISHGWFDRIEVYFLKPGHSHDMVDALCFAPLGRKARETYTFWTPDEFQNMFIPKAFRGSKRQQPVFLDPVIVFDWQEWLDTQLKNVSQQSFQRAYLFTLQQGEAKPVMFYKKHLLKTCWIGYKRQPDRGLSLFHQPLEGSPEILPPVPIPEEDLQDISSLSAMPSQHQAFWENFATGDQFAIADYVTMPETWQENFWGENSSSSSSSSFSISSQSEETDEERHVVIPWQNHQPFIPPDQLHVGSIVAIKPNEDYEENHPNEQPSPFWLAKIKGIKKRQNTYFYKLGWFFNQNIDNPNLPAQYVYHDHITDVFPYSSILHYNIELTPQNRLQQSDIRIINNMLNQ